METVPAKNMVFRAKNPDAWFGAEYNMNIYRGCTHGCIYCDSRSECYRIEDFDQVKVKENAVQLIRDNLRSKRKCGVVATGAMSDPYNPLEARLQLTRQGMELIDTYEFGVAVDTKSPLVARDIDVFQRIQTHDPVLIKMTITAFDDDLCSKIEPRVPVSSERFLAIEKLADHEVFCGVLMMPILPFINDTEENILKLVRRSKEAGAKFIFPGFGVTMRPGNREYLFRNLDRHFPGIKEKYISSFGADYQCNSPKGKALWYLFRDECEKLGLQYKMKDIIAGYKKGYGDKQMSMFDSNEISVQQ